jgi:hypothetical protein
VIRAIKNAWNRWRHPLMCSVVRFDDGPFRFRRARCYEVLAQRISRLWRGVLSPKDLEVCGAHPAESQVTAGLAEQPRTRNAGRP